MMRRTLLPATNHPTSSARSASRRPENPPIQRTTWLVSVIAGVAVAATAAVLGPAYADPGQADLEKPFATAGGPFIGQWVAHGEHVTVNPDGTGVEMSSRGAMNFMLTFVSSGSNPWDTATGNVTGGILERGSYVALQLTDGGRGMNFSAGGGDANFPFCKTANGKPLNSADCGA
jgi:hypothetical protein